MRKLAAIFLLAAAPCFSVRRVPAAGPPIAKADRADAYAIYSFLFTREWAQAPKTRYAIVENTLSAAGAPWEQPQLALDEQAFYGAALADLRQKARSSYSLEKGRFKMRGHYVLLSAPEMRAAAEMMSVAAAKRTGPYKKIQMLYQISPVGFNAARDRA